MATDNNIRNSLLIVDDNEEILEFLTDDLSEKYCVHSATSVSKALQIITGQSIDLIISDILMPEIDGYTFCRSIKSDLHYSHIPIILLTAKNTLQSKIEGLDLGADAYIEKPFSPQYLHVQISNLLQNRMRIKQYFCSSINSQLSSIASNYTDKDFLEKLETYISENMDNPDLSVNELAENLYMSRPSLYRKIKEISDLTPNKLINIARLKKAAELLSQKDRSINEVAILVGFNSLSHFGRNFQKQFGMSPSIYQNKKANHLKENNSF